VPFELQIALRYLLAKRRQVFISVITLVSTLGVTVGVMALVIALAIMTGLQQELQSRILGAMAHVNVWKTSGIQDYRAEVARVEQVPGIVAAAPAVYGKALVSADRADSFVTLKGIDPQFERNVTEVAGAMTGGSLEALAEQSGEDALPGIVIGHALAGAVGAFVGDTVTLITPQGSLTPFGLAPRQLRVRVVGTFRLGLIEFDSAYGFVSIELAQRLTGKTDVDLLEARVGDVYQAPAIAEGVAARLGSDYVAGDWTDQNQTLYSALYLEKIAMGLGIGLIVGVAALNIVASLILLVMEKTRDIAILKTMGASARSVMMVFLIQGIVIGTIGTIVGAALGATIAHFLDRYRVISIPGDVYQVTYLPFRVLPWDLVAIVAGGLVVCFFATLYPSRQAARLDPAQALRYE
jgi:lipoprotein-releasing system permease protein